MTSNVVLSKDQKREQLIVESARDKALRIVKNLRISNMTLFDQTHRPRTTPALFDGSALDPLNTVIPKVPTITIPPEWKAEENEPDNNVDFTTNISLIKRDRKSRYTANVRNRSSSGDKKIGEYRTRPKHWVSVEHLNELRNQAEVAIKQHKVFMIRGGFHSLRKALLKRGWVEKIDPNKSPRSLCPVQSCSEVTVGDLTDDLPRRKPGESMSAHNDKCTRMILNKFLAHTPVDFYWIMRRERIDPNTCRNMTCSRFQYVPFTNKEGLCNSLRDIHWHYEEGIADIRFPRCYNIWMGEEFEEFTEDFRLTACISLLKWIVTNVDAKGERSVCSSEGQVPYSTIHFAMKRCDEFLASRKHVDLDDDKVTPTIWEHEWDQFLRNQHLLTHENAKIMEDKNCSINVLQAASKNTISIFQKHWPQMDIDGMMNIWIVKPGNKCRGRGIRLMNNIKDIASIIDCPLVPRAKYIVQKYIEKPLIIHSTKFDIRQWFLVTSVQPLMVWMYKESYLRFSSQQFDLENYHESVHLTNNAVQCKYKNGKRDTALPDENMWDNQTFQNYLKSIGQTEMWNEKIYPGMRQAIVAALLSSQENMDRRPNTFELFGADFMLSEDFSPWLLEINSSPDMAPTTSVTARLCPQCLEDVIKVTIDRKADIKASTGNFELIYSQKMPRAPAYLGQHLIVRGHRMIRPQKSGTNRKEPPSSSSFNIDQISGARTWDRKLESSSEHIRPVIGDFIEYLKSKSDISAMVEESNGSEANVGYSFEQPIEQEQDKKKKRKGVFLNSDFSDNLSDDDNICVNDNDYNSDFNLINNSKFQSNVYINSNRIFNNRQKFLMCRKNLNERNQKTNERNLENVRKRLETRETEFSNDHLRLRHRHCFTKGVWERNTASILDVSTPFKNRRIGYNSALQTPSTAFVRTNKENLSISSQLRASTSHLISSKKAGHYGQGDGGHASLLAVGLSINQLKAKYQKIKRRNNDSFNSKYKNIY